MKRSFPPVRSPRPLLHQIFGRGSSWLAALALALLLAVPAGAATSWAAYTYVTPKLTTGVMMQELAQKVSGDDTAAMKLDVHYGGSLPIKATNITQAVSQGAVIQFADDGFPYGNIKIAGILNLPMLLTTEAQFEQAIGIAFDAIRDEFAANGVELLAIYHYPLQVLWSAGSVQSFADIEGMKIRVSSPQQSEFVKTYKGVPVTLGTPEVAPALQQGVINGVLTASTGGAKVWEDLLDSTYRLGPNYFASYLIANKKAFDALDGAQRDRVRELAAERASWAEKTMASEEKKLTGEMAERGMVVTERSDVDVEDGAERLAAYWQSWAQKQGPDATALLEEIRAAIGK